MHTPAAFASQRQIGRQICGAAIRLHSKPGAHSDDAVHASFSRLVRVASGQAQSTWSIVARHHAREQAGHPPRVAAAAARGSQLNVQVWYAVRKLGHITGPSQTLPGPPPPAPNAAQSGVAVAEAEAHLHGAAGIRVVEALRAGLAVRVGVARRARPRRCRPQMHSLRGGAFDGGMQSTWQVCVAMQVVTPSAALCGSDRIAAGQRAALGSDLGGARRRRGAVGARHQRDRQVRDAALLDLLRPSLRRRRPVPTAQPSAVERIDPEVDRCRSRCPRTRPTACSIGDLIDRRALAVVGEVAHLRRPLGDDDLDLVDVDDRRRRRRAQRQHDERRPAPNSRRRARAPVNAATGEALRTHPCSRRWCRGLVGPDPEHQPGQDDGDRHDATPTAAQNQVFSIDGSAAAAAAGIDCSSA